MAKFQEKAKARGLRKRGLSIKLIAKNLKVSTSSVSTWCRDINLSDIQLEELERHARDPFYGKRLKYIQELMKQTNTKIDRLKKEGIKEIGKLSKRELFLVGVVLYWTEGFKKDSQAGFANSDPKMINLFLRWLFESCNYEPEDLIFRVTLNISHKYRIKEVEKFWSDSAKISIKSFRKPFFQNFIWKKVYENPHEYYGVLRIKVRKSKDFLRKIHGWIEGLRLQTKI